ncbi:hypothetical protein [Acanthopleuribacter pedis]|uniref:Uncharacterized protein n=1 Tax=Acanthopleuribacter pedis TaxID=442870 RepID=A0A8J7Q740_9BACT|nr:hypothetical protein [Acanthopleuribacter pedis]MBO1321802.1 hypothetical protein [Acanthopleuribacter pedis]
MKSQGERLAQDMIDQIEKVLSGDISRSELLAWYRNEDSKFTIKGSYGTYPPLTKEQGFDVFVNLGFVCHKNPLDRSEFFLRDIDLNEYLGGLKKTSRSQKNGLIAVRWDEIIWFRDAYCLGFMKEDSLLSQLGVQLVRWVDDFSELGEFCQIKLGEHRVNLTRSLTKSPCEISLSIPEPNLTHLKDFIGELGISSNKLVWKSKFVIL